MIKEYLAHSSLIVFITSAITATWNKLKDNLPWLHIWTAMNKVFPHILQRIIQKKKKMNLATMSKS
jgi:hypothetical protein